MFKDKINNINDSWLIIFIEIVAIAIASTGIALASIYLLPSLLGNTITVVLLIALLSVIGLLALKVLLIVCVRLYRLLAKPSLRNRCRYTPTCSHYMIVSLRKHILIVGLFRGLRRISRCHPPHGGIDMP